MGLVEQQIARTLIRADFDVPRLIASTKSLVPAEIASRSAQHDREQFLVSSLGDANLAHKVYERILQGNELQPINYLERGTIAARAVARVVIQSAFGAGYGTGFLIAPQVLLTNNHVLPDEDTARQSTAQFLYEVDLGDTPREPLTFRLDPDRLFETSVDLDFTAVALAASPGQGVAGLDGLGYLPLLRTVGKAFEGEWLTVIQHPGGERKQICVRENRLLKRDKDVLWYSTDTLQGSSGSPVFNNDWFVVALHHSGIPEMRDGVIQTVDGTDYDPATMDDSRIKWVANAGIRASRIAETLAQRRPDHPLLRPMFAATPETARIRAPAPIPTAPLKPVATKPEATPMPQFPIDVTVRVNADGSANILGDLGREATVDFRERARKPRTPRFTVPVDHDYGKENRRGYKENFLDNEVIVKLPQIGPGLQAEAAKIISNGQETSEFILNYRNFSVVMHAKRRLAIYSAANVDFAHRYDMSRPEDDWRFDPRIKQEHQLGNWYYANNKFDRGHLTRREDLEYGDTPQGALLSAADTCHWTNCTPQHSQFNQNRDVWHGIERYILESTILEGGGLKAQVITGPILDDGDPEYRGIQYPLSFWKVVAAIGAENRLYATAYLASQGAIIDRHGIEVTPPFGAFGTFQVRVEEIERLTGLVFKAKVKQAPEASLTKFDPFQEATPRRRRRARAFESAFANLPEGYAPIQSLDDIEVGF